jgi:hypothetical protein
MQPEFATASDPSFSPEARSLSRIWALRLTGPMSLLPLGILIFLLFGTYDSGEIGHLQSIPLFLQGSTDLFGSCLFAATMASYVVFGLTASIYLTLRLAEARPADMLIKDIARGIWSLKYHIALFTVFGLAPVKTFDSLIRPNDFRNMFALACVLYTGSFLLSLGLFRMQLPIRKRLVLGPALLVLWIVVGSDGTTAKAGQILYAGENPETSPRGKRHGLMLEWHRICDGSLGDAR